MLSALIQLTMLVGTSQLTVIEVTMDKSHNSCDKGIVGPSRKTSLQNFLIEHVLIKNSSQIKFIQNVHKQIDVIHFVIFALLSEPLVHFLLVLLRDYKAVSLDTL